MVLLQKIRFHRNLIVVILHFRDFYKITLARRIAKRIEAGFSKEEDETYNNDMTSGQVIVD